MLGFSATMRTNHRRRRVRSSSFGFGFGFWLGRRWRLGMSGEDLQKVYGEVNVRRWLWVVVGGGLLAVVDVGLRWLGLAARGGFDLKGRCELLLPSP